LEAHGQVIQSLSAYEYGWQLAYRTRLLTGHWMFFLLSAAATWSKNARRK
jgi:hypothetical protein